MSNLFPPSTSFTTPRPAEETIDRLSKWKKRWHDNMIGWHKEEVHHFLLKHGHQIIPSFNPDATGVSTCQSQEGTVTTTSNQDKLNSFRIFVPLCGKTVDMTFLAKQESVSQVVGIDGISKALLEFAQENPSFDIIPQNDNTDFVVERFVGKGIELLRGDLFDVNDDVTNGKFDMILDRASMVAIQPTLREKYVNTLGKVIKPGGSILLITLDRRSGDEEARKNGPPFSIDEEEVKRLYGNIDWVESIQLVEEHDEFQDEKNRQRFEGLDSMYELCFIITAKK